MHAVDVVPGVGRHLRAGPVVGLAAATALFIGTVFADTAAAEHVGCGDVITSNTRLDSNVGPCTGDGLIVRGDNVTLDLNSFRVFAENGPGDNAGIRLANVTGSTVQNGIVEKFDAGIFIGRGSDNTVRDVTARDNVNDFLSPPCDLGDGITILDSSDNTIVDNRALRNGPYSGISVVGDSDRNVIRHNVASDNNIQGRAGSGCGNNNQDEGIRIEGPGANDNQVLNNRVERNLLAGIGLHGHVCGGDPDDRTDPNTGTIIRGNLVRDTAGSTVAAGINFLQQGPAGIVCPSFENTVERNSSSGNEGDGIFVAAASHDNKIRHNRVERNEGSGLKLADPRFSNQFTNRGPTVFDLVSPDRAPFTEGTDFQVLSGSGSGNVTGTLRAIDIAIPPGGGPTNPNPPDTSTSGCEASDFANAGFQPGDVALIQRGTCTFVSKVQNAIAAGASAVVLFNEGQPGRTTANFGSVGPVDIPVLSASFAVGQELFNLTQAGEVVINVVTNTTNVRTLAAPAPFDNTLIGNRGQKNAEFDGYDGNLEPPCDNNKWRASKFVTVNQPCVVGPGGSGKARGRTGGPGRSEDAGPELGRKAPPPSDL